MTRRQTQPAQRRAAILMEVVLALTLFVMASGVMVGAMNSAAKGARLVRLETIAQSQAATILAMVQTGQLPAVNDGPNPFQDEQLDGWTWEVIVTPIGVENDVEPSMDRIEIVIARPGETYTYRLAQLMLAPQEEQPEDADLENAPAPADNNAPSGGGGPT